MAGSGEATTSTSSTQRLPNRSIFSNWSTARTAALGTRTTARSLAQSNVPDQVRARFDPVAPGRGRPALSRKKTVAPAGFAPRRFCPFTRARISICPSRPTSAAIPVRSLAPDFGNSTTVFESPRGLVRTAPPLTTQEAGSGSPSSKSPLRTRFVDFEPPTGTSSIVNPSTSRTPVAPMSPTERMASRQAGGTDRRFETWTHLGPMDLVHGPSRPRRSARSCLPRKSMTRPGSSPSRSP